MTDYIKREDALKAVDDIVCDSDNAERTCDRIIDIPTADVVPVRHGRWEAFEDMVLDTCYRCSECGGEFYLADCGTPQENEYNYCPNCGAKMDGESNG